MSHGLGKERVVSSGFDVLYLRCQWKDQEAMFGREILKFTGEVGARKTFG